MKKILGLLAICTLVACNESGETAVAPVSGGNQNAYQDPNQQQVNADSIYQHVLDSINAAQAMSSAAIDPFSSSSVDFFLSSSAIMPLSSSSMVFPTVSSSSFAISSSSIAIVRSSSSAIVPKSSAAVDDGKFKLELWDGAAGEAQVQTGNKTGGWWYSYADELGSEITWGAELGDEGSMAPVVAACEGLCGDFVIGEGDPSENKYPYLGFAFGYAKSASTTGDATAIKGLCVTYTYSGTATFAIELGLTTAQENKLGSALPMAELPKGTKKTVDYLWSEFVQPDWAKTAMSGANAAKQLSSIKFKFADAVGGESGSFAVYKVGPYGGCN